MDCFFPYVKKEYSRSCHRGKVIPLMLFLLSLLILVIGGDEINLKTLNGIFGSPSEQVLRTYRENDSQGLTSLIKEAKSSFFSKELFENDLVGTIFAIKRKLSPLLSDPNYQPSYLSELQFLKESFENLNKSEFHKIRLGLVHHFVISCNNLTQEEQDKVKMVLNNSDKIFQKSDPFWFTQKEFIVPKLEDVILLSSSLTLPRGSFINRTLFYRNGTPYPYFFPLVLRSCSLKFQELSILLLKVYAEFTNTMTQDDDPLSTLLAKWISLKNSLIEFEMSKELSQFDDFLKMFRKSSVLGAVPLILHPDTSDDAIMRGFLLHCVIIRHQILAHAMRRQRTPLNDSIDCLVREILEFALEFLRSISLLMPFGQVQYDKWGSCAHSC